jgi:hypothetical protein
LKEEEFGGFLWLPPSPPHSRTMSPFRTALLRWRRATEQDFSISLNPSWEQDAGPLEADGDLHHKVSNAMFFFVY